MATASPQENGIIPSSSSSEPPNPTQSLTSGIGEGDTPALDTAHNHAPAPAPAPAPTHTPATTAIHADDPLNSPTTFDVAPSIHLSTTFRYAANPTLLVPAADKPLTSDGPASSSHVYSRITNPNAARLEALLGALLRGHALAYSSGLSAFHALLVFFNPKVVAVGQAYHGCYGVLALHKKMTGLRRVDLHGGEEAWDAIGEGDLVHVETPMNPTGRAVDIALFAEKAHKRGAVLSVDATFAPPGLQDPFAQGADVVMHSGTKYLGGHSDMLCGVLAVKRVDWWEGLHGERRFLGSIVGGLEGWLGIRSVRTLELRVQRQSRNAEEMVRWMDGCVRGLVLGVESDAVRRTVESVEHASLQREDLESGWLRKQMPGGFGPVFAVVMKEESLARRLPSKLELFHHATSLGGVESLIEWRSMSDEGCDRRLMRLSIGVEDVDDLRADLGRALMELANGK